MFCSKWASHRISRLGMDWPSMRDFAEKSILEKKSTTVLYRWHLVVWDRHFHKYCSESDRTTWDTSDNVCRDLGKGRHSIYRYKIMFNWSMNNSVNPKPYIAWNEPVKILHTACFFETFKDISISKLLIKQVLHYHYNSVMKFIFFSNTASWKCDSLIYKNVDIILTVALHRSFWSPFDLKYVLAFFRHDMHVVIYNIVR
jgi:hypothetical protein